MVKLFGERGGDPERAGKRDPLDPLLWRRERPGEPAWDGGTLGTGRPGWHVECAVIARDGLGLPFDVQGGGVDLQFPHHEMSTSHARVLDDGRGAQAHVHAGMVGLDGEKMSKSRGNLVLVSALRAQGVDPMAIRLALLGHHYATDWEWTDAGPARTPPTGWPAGAPPRRRRRPARTPTATVEAVRAALAEDLDAPRAVAAVDAWADRALAVSGDGVRPASPRTIVPGAPALVAAAVDALARRPALSLGRDRPAAGAATAPGPADPVLPAGTGAGAPEPSGPGALVAPPQVALELAGDRLAARLGQLGGVLGLLELVDVLGDLRVLGRELVDAVLPRDGVVGQLAQRDRLAEQLLDAGEQRERRLGRRRVRDVVRHGRPQRQRPQPAVRRLVLQHADDAGRAPRRCSARRR